MKRKILVCSLLLFLLGCAGPSRAFKQQLPPVSEACGVLKEFRGEYSYGGVGDGAQSNDGELAVWVIFHSPNTANQLVELFPQCQSSGKAYVLAALYHSDQAAFQKLTNAFCQEPGDIITGSGCTESSETRAELVVEMQRSRSTMAFHPSTPPYRFSSMNFLGSHRDVYAEQRAWEEARNAEMTRGFAAFVNNPKLAAFTNLFQVDEPNVGRGYTQGVYFSGSTELAAYLVPREKLAFPAMVEVIFPETNQVAQVGIEPAELMNELRDLTGLPFLKQVDEELGVTCVRIRAAGDRFHWDTKEVEHFENVLQTKVPIDRWVHFIVDAGTKRHRMISFYHPKGTDIYVVDYSLFDNPDWRNQYAKITGKKPTMMAPLAEGIWNEPDPIFTPVVDRAGRLTLVNSPKM
jgi:hypothetical protein